MAKQAMARALKEHRKRDARAWPPPSWEEADWRQWRRDRLTRIVRGHEALQARVQQSADCWLDIKRYEVEVESFVFELLQTPRPPGEPAELGVRMS